MGDCNLRSGAFLLLCFFGSGGKKIAPLFPETDYTDKERGHDRRLGDSLGELLVLFSM